MRREFVLPKQALRCKFTRCFSRVKHAKIRYKCELDLQLPRDRIDGMKTQLSFRIIFTGVVFALLSACATYAPAVAPLVGTWTNSLVTVCTVKADNTFVLVIPNVHIGVNITLAG